MDGVPALVVGPARARRGRAASCLCSKGASRPVDPPQAATATAIATAIVPIGLTYEWTA